jgi:hypothetical protein
MNYNEKLQHPFWQKKRLEIFDRDNWHCQGCGDGTTQLEVHHLEYFKGKEPWEYPEDMLITCCRNCHQSEELRFKHEKYLMRALKFTGFLAMDILAFASLLQKDKEFKNTILSKIREFAKQ